MLPNYQARSPFVLKHTTSWRASVASETLTGLTSGVLEHKWRASLKTILFLLTSNTEATENKVQFF